MKKAVCLLLFGAMVLSIAGCSGGVNGNTETQSIVSNSSETSQSVPVGVDLKDCKGVALAFFESLRDKDLDKSFSLLSKPDGSFITKEGFDWQLPRTEYSAITELSKDLRVEVASDSYSSNRALITLNVYTGEDEWDYDKYHIYLCSDKDDNWGIDPEGGGSYSADLEFAKYSFCYTNWHIILPSNTKVTINGIDIPDNLIASKNTSNYAMMTEYVIPYVDIKPVTVEFKSDNFTNKVENVEAVSNNSYDSMKDCIFAIAEDKVYSDSIKFIQSMFADIMKQYSSGKKSDSINKWVCSKEIANKIWDDIQYMASPKSISGCNEDFKMTKCLEDDSNKPYWLTNDIVAVPFRYELQWYRTGFGSGTQSMHNSDVILLQCKDGEYKIYDISETGTGLFKWANQFTSTW